MLDKIENDKTPKINERDNDVILLARRYIKDSQEQLHTGPKELSDESKEYLLSHDWSDNEQDLEMAIKRACVMSDGVTLRKEDFDLEHRQARSIGKFVESRLRGFMRNIKSFESFNLYDMVIPEVEKSLILMVMKETKGNQLRAARLLGINRNTLRTKIKKLGINLKKRSV